MEFTGFYYSFYFDKNTDIVIEELKNTNFCYEEREFNGEKSYFFYKNDEMYENHLENGYSLDKNGEGCFCLETKRVPINGEAFWQAYPDIPAHFFIKEVNYIF